MGKKTEPEKKTNFETENVKSLGGTREEFGPRGKGRSQLTFTPRVLSTAAKGQAAVKLAPMKFVKPGGGGETTKNGGDRDHSAKESNESEKSKNGSKSNSDFRNMFLK